MEGVATHDIPLLNFLKYFDVEFELNTSEK